ncbi:phosphatase PAP2 family protein [Pedococcus sp. KACC 23699]|uniref:Phosphatase PAP2 family protein n=1 Tax=Pedococcus sp. KACC 23699 TaxID=3149228 RepID=A0AAU7JYC8_9MICO
MSAWDNALDRWVTGFVVAHRSAGATAVADAVMWLGATSRGLVLLAVGGAIVVIAFRAWRTVFAAVLALAAAAVAAATLKSVFERPRPPADLAMVLTTGYSFPSTQATETAAVAVAVVLTAPWARRPPSRPVAVALAAVTALVGVCMVYLGAHWTTDVLAGWLIGAVIGAAASGLVLAVSRLSVGPLQRLARTRRR